MQIQDGNLGVTLATWTFLLLDRGLRPRQDRIGSALDALVGAGEGAPLTELGQRLVDAVREGLGKENPSFSEVRDAVTAWYGEDALATDFGAAADRELRGRTIRRYQFARGLPWIACIIDRFPNGHVGEHWVMVQDVSERVLIMDPYPWDDVDEQYDMPLADFMVKWELAGLESLRIR